MAYLFVSKTGLVKRGRDGQEAIVFTDGDSRDGSERWADVLALPEPKEEVGTELHLSNSQRVRLPFTELAWLLPDKTGVLVIFKAGAYINTDGSDIFPAPNNAAIYNADGSLRCRVQFAGTSAMSADYIIERPFTRMIIHKAIPSERQGERIESPIVQFGVLVGTKELSPESFFVLNTETGELKNGLFTVPY